MINNKPTYISLFSSAGVGCYGFKLAGFECVATNELIERRLNIQKLNEKCSYPSGYINGDITLEATKELIFKEIALWKQLGNDKVDVVIATPPCQGMSVANHSKSDKDLHRNSLIIESVQLVKQIQPRFFVFENVSAFWKTGCYYQKQVVAIGEMITQELGDSYNFECRVINFKNYGANSSRPRTLVIGVHKSLADKVLPLELFPDYCPEPTLRQVIGHLKPLQWGEFDPDDYFHSFRTYPEHMRAWIANVKPGQSAFDNEQDYLKPHQVIDGKIVINQAKNQSKYTRQDFDRVAPCVHTRNDIMSSQNTVHPVEDRVFSIRELMHMMTIPDSFRWLPHSLAELNAKSQLEKQALAKKEELNIRQSLGEAVPTAIFEQIASKIGQFLSYPSYSSGEIEQIISENNLVDALQLQSFVTEKLDRLGFDNISRIAELANAKRESYAAFYTGKILLNEIIKQLPDSAICFKQSLNGRTVKKKADKGKSNKVNQTNATASSSSNVPNEALTILEPSVGMGNFIPLLIKKYAGATPLHFTLVDKDSRVIELLKVIFSRDKLPDNVTMEFICGDYLQLNFKEKFDLVIGNPPFSKITASELQTYNNYLASSDVEKGTPATFKVLTTKDQSVSHINTKNIKPEWQRQYEVISKMVSPTMLPVVLRDVFGEAAFDFETESSHNCDSVAKINDGLVDFELYEQGELAFASNQSKQDNATLSRQYSSNLRNLSGLFLEKALRDGYQVSLVMPKNLLNTQEYSQTRELLAKYNISSILDFGEKGFPGVLIETINITVSSEKHSIKGNKVYIKSLTANKELYQEREYIFDKNLPYWVIYRDDFFDKVFHKMDFGVFKVFRDRQITNSHLSDVGDIRVLKSRNIDDLGDNVVDLSGYDAFINNGVAENLAVYRFKERDDVYLTPNMTYNPRLMKKDKGYITNGSIAVLELIDDIEINESQRRYIASDEFRKFYAIARNYQTRSLNVDNSSVFWFGINKEV